MPENNDLTSSLSVAPHIGEDFHQRCADSVTGEGRVRDLSRRPLGHQINLQAGLREKLVRISDALLAPWQKLGDFRAHLLPSHSHNLSTGRVQMGFLDELDVRCAEFHRHVSFVLHTAHTDFVYGSTGRWT